MKYDAKVISFRNLEEWKNEMVRTGCKGWRLTYLNQRFHLSSTCVILSFQNFFRFYMIRVMKTPLIVMALFANKLGQKKKLF